MYLKFCPLGRPLSFTLLLFRATPEWALISWWSTSACCHPRISISLSHSELLMKWYEPMKKVSWEKWQRGRCSPTRKVENVLFQFFPWGSSKGWSLIYQLLDYGIYCLQTFLGLRRSENSKFMMGNWGSISPGILWLVGLSGKQTVVFQKNKSYI